MASVFFKPILLINIQSSPCEIDQMWMPQIRIDDESALIQVLAWYRQVTSHYLTRCWPNTVSWYGVTRALWIDAWLNSTMSCFDGLTFFILVLLISADGYGMAISRLNPHENLSWKFSQIYKHDIKRWLIGEMNDILPTVLHTSSSNFIPKPL